MHCIFSFFLSLAFSLLRVKQSWVYSPLLNYSPYIISPRLSYTAIMAERQQPVEPSPMLYTPGGNRQDGIHPIINNPPRRYEQGNSDPQAVTPGKWSTSINACSPRDVCQCILTLPDEKSQPDLLDIRLYGMFLSLRPLRKNTCPTRRPISSKLHCL